MVCGRGVLCLPRGAARGCLRRRGYPPSVLLGVSVGYSCVGMGACVEPLRVDAVYSCYWRAARARRARVGISVFVGKLRT